MQVNNNANVSYVNKADSEGIQQTDELEVQELFDVNQANGTGEKAGTKRDKFDEAYQLACKDFDLKPCEEARKGYGHFIAAMPQGGQGNPAMIAGTDKIFAAGAKVYEKFADKATAIITQYAQLKDKPNMTEGALKAALARCQEKLEKEAEKVKVQLERMTVIAQTYMMVAVLDQRAKEGGINSNETIQSLFDAAVEVEKHEVTDQELEAYKRKNEKPEGEKAEKTGNGKDEPGINMQKQISQIEKKIERKQKEIDKPENSDFKKRQAQNAINVMTEIRDMYIKLQNGEKPEVLAPPLESLLA